MAHFSCVSSASGTVAGPEQASAVGQNSFVELPSRARNPALRVTPDPPHLRVQVTPFTLVRSSILLLLPVLFLCQSVAAISGSRLNS